MALIKCPECEKEISDKAEKCVHCGHEFENAKRTYQDTESDIKKCSECGGALYDTKSNDCPYCGCPIEKEKETTAVCLEALPSKLSRKTKKIVLGIITVAAVLVIMAVSFSLYSQGQSTKNEAVRFNEYIDNLNSAQAEMLSSASTAETLSNTVKRVWNSAIFDNKSKWDSDIKSFYSDDFNEAIGLLYDSPDTLSKLSSISEGEKRAGEVMAKLQNPPSELVAAYGSAQEMYSQYTKLTELAKSPSGNIQTYGSNVNDSIDGFMSAYKTLKTQIPEKKE